MHYTLVIPLDRKVEDRYRESTEQAMMVSCADATAAALLESGQYFLEADFVPSICQTFIPVGLLSYYLTHT
jgi:hypothetical protein